MGLLTATLILVAFSAARAQATATLTTLYSFSANEGFALSGPLIEGNDGDFYGVTDQNLKEGNTVFKVTPEGVLMTLYTFTGGADGTNPYALVEGSDGNFYGTTGAGGNKDGDGTVFKVTPAGKMTTLYRFTGGNDGAQPGGALVEGSDGNFYGTTRAGGAGSDGTIFQLTPAGVPTTLYSFTGGIDGIYPCALVEGSDGNFYGTTAQYDINGKGTVFKVTPAGVLTTLHLFNSSSDGATPNAALVEGSDGNFYGTTSSGGYNTGRGTIFKVTPAGGLTILYRFTGSDGAAPTAALVEGRDGNFYGTTTYGGANDDGTVFQITPAGVLTTLYSFTGGTDGERPYAGLVEGGDGNFYGTTGSGGANGHGTIFKVAVTAPAFFDGEIALSDGVYYLAFPNGNYFGYYSFLSDSHYLYHFDLGFEYVFDAADGKAGVYFYDFASSDFFYTSPSFPFPYLYDFNLNTVLYYFPDPNNAGHYNTDGVRYFYDFNTGQIISK